MSTYYLSHAGIKGMKWGYTKDPNYKPVGEPAKGNNVKPGLANVNGSNHREHAPLPSRMKNSLADREAKRTEQKEAIQRLQGKVKDKIDEKSHEFAKLSEARDARMYAKAAKANEAGNFGLAERIRALEKARIDPYYAHLRVSGHGKNAKLELEHPYDALDYTSATFSGKLSDHAIRAYSMVGRSEVNRVLDKIKKANKSSRKKRWQEA